MSTTSHLLSEPVPDGDIVAECIIVGSGAGGSLAAAHLTRLGKSVVVLEEGGEEVLAEPGITTTFPNLWREGGAIPVMSNTSFVFGEGRAVGGSTEINAGLLHRLPEDIVRTWSETYAVADLSYNELERLQDELAQELGSTPTAAGSTLERRLTETVEKFGWRGGNVPVIATKKGERYEKRTMRRTYLAEAVARGARVFSRCRVNRLMLEGDVAKGVEIEYRLPTGERCKRKIRGEQVFVCAGSVQSALLLRRSGITRNVGNSQQFHPTLRVLAEFPDTIGAHEHLMLPLQIREFLPTITLGASITTPGFIASSLVSDWYERRDLMRDPTRLALFYVGIKSDARGTIRNLPLPGAYTIRYFLEQEDAQHIGFGLAKLAELLFAAGATRLYPSIARAPAIPSVEDAMRYEQTPPALSNLSLVAIHSYSSCPIGERPDYAAADSFGKVHGLQNVFVMDAGALPTSPGVNPQGPLMAIALRNLRHWFS